MNLFGSQKDYITWRWWKDVVFTVENCPFCDEKLQKEYLCWEGECWKIIHNRFPYSWTPEHLMLVPKRHVQFSYELESVETAELSLAYRWLKDFYGDKNYFSCTRETISNRSVEHLHIHFIPWTMRAKVIQKMLQLQGFPIEWEITI